MSTAIRGGTPSDGTRITIGDVEARLFVAFDSWPVELLWLRTRLRSERVAQGVFNDPGQCRTAIEGRLLGRAEETVIEVQHL